MPPGPGHAFDPDRLDEAARVRRARDERARRDSHRSIGQDLALAGVIGWTIVVPMLVGIAAGRWLDHRFATGIFWTLGLLVAGVGLGSAAAWRRLMHS